VVARTLDAEFLPAEIEVNIQGNGALATREMVGHAREDRVHRPKLEQIIQVKGVLNHENNDDEERYLVCTPVSDTVSAYQTSAGTGTETWSVLVE
jgi:hypothetical protein